MAIGKRLTLRGFIVCDHGDLQAGSSSREVGGWLREGRSATRETVVEGGSSTRRRRSSTCCAASNTGKMLVRL